MAAPQALLCLHGRVQNHWELALVRGLWHLKMCSELLIDLE